MAISFVSPSLRAAQSDLTIAISPLGLVELADEEFEVHGPRLNRYATSWAFYLGHHWAYRREVGESQLVFNYTKALSDYITNFTFGRDVVFRSLHDEYGAIIPMRLKRVWEIDNIKPQILWEMGNLGGVSGDLFVKVAYEEPFVDAVGRPHNGRVRVLPLNPSFCFPEYHPHDRTRLIRFKLKYRFWGTALEGTRQVFTYTELITDDFIEEYVNDELIDSRPNPLGRIPVVPIANTMVPSSPWGLSDIQDILSLNQEYNEKATEVSDIINYHSAPVTVITGAKASQLEKGPKKVWGGLPEKAHITNLELNPGTLGPSMEYLNVLKRAMHEMTGVPEGALGEMQPISNTSGVALAITYQPLMNRYNQKQMTYGVGFQQINELILMHLALKEPWVFEYNPNTDPEITRDQVTQIDPNAAETYQTKCHWPAPLPVDVLIKLAEIQQKMALGLESKRGGLELLGEEFPDEKAAEIFEELIEDAMDQGALDLVKAQITQAVAVQTGMIPDGEGGMTSAGGPDVTTSSDASGSGGGGAEPGAPTPTTVSPEVRKIMTELTTLAYGSRRPSSASPST